MFSIKLIIIKGWNNDDIHLIHCFKYKVLNTNFGRKSIQNSMFIINEKWSYLHKIMEKISKANINKPQLLI